MNFKIESHACSIAAVKPSEGNEDCHLILSHNFGTIDQTVLCVSDGMGGLQRAREASRTALKTILKCAADSQLQTEDELKEIILSANQAIIDLYNNEELGATISLGIITENILLIGHVGDCRIHHFTEKKLFCLTEDHTRLAEAIAQGKEVSADSIDLFARQLTKSLGTRKLTSSDIWVKKVELKSGDILVFCSDGVWSEITEHEMASILTGCASDVAVKLAELAHSRDQSDDVTVVVSLIR